MIRTLLAVVTAVLILPATADAAFPGANGRIAFNWNFGCDGSMIWTMQPDGSDRRRLTPDSCKVDGPPEAAFPDWTADGSNILFMRGYRIATMTAQGAGVGELGIQGLTNAAKPSVSPTGGRVAYTRVKNGVQTIYTAKFDGSEEKKLRNGHGPRYSPDGQLIAFSRNGSTRITIMRAKTGKLVRTLDARAGQLDWAPGGRRLVFTRSDDLYVIRADGSRRPRRLLHTDRAELSPIWSPDGERIAFVRRLASGEEEVQYAVYTMPADGGKTKRILRTGEQSAEETISPLDLSWQPVVGP